MALITPPKRLVIAGREFTADEMDSMIHLVGFVTTQGRYATLRKINSSSGYVVPSLKTFKWEVVTIGIVGSVVSGAQMGYGTNDVGFESASAPSGLVVMGGGGSFAFFGVAQANGSDGTTPSNSQATFFTTPAGFYPSIRSINASTSFHVYGHEV